MATPKKVQHLQYSSSARLLVSSRCSSIVCQTRLSKILLLTIFKATEIQNIQIADGDVCRNFKIPIYMIFPRLFTCPTLSTRTFKIEFEVNIVMLLENGHLISENFPIQLVR